MNCQHSFESEAFAVNNEFEELETLDMEVFEQWQGETSTSSPQRLRWIQEALNKILGLKLKTDGIMGSQTRSAIRSFQQKQGLVIDGIVGPKTEAALVAVGAGRTPSQLAETHTIKPGNTTTGLIYTYQETPHLQDKLLYDFDINGAALKPAHKSTLDNIIKFMANDVRQRIRSGRRWRVSLDGYASRTGEAKWNKELSRERMYSVNDYMQTHLYVDGFDLGPYVDFNREWHGFEQTTGPGENPLGRSVRIAVHRPNSPPPTT